MGEIDCKQAIGHYTGAGDELDVEDFYTKYKVCCVQIFMIHLLQIIILFVSDI